MGAFVFQDPPSFPALPFVCFSVSSVSKPPLSRVYEAAVTVSAVPCAGRGAPSCPSCRGQSPHRELGSGLSIAHSAPCPAPGHGPGRLGLHREWRNSCPSPACLSVRLSCLA